MTTWDPTTPTAPGLYFYSAGDGSATRQYRVYIKDTGFMLVTHAEYTVGSTRHDMVSLPTTGYWQPVTIPEPYVAPKPPELKVDEVWEVSLNNHGPTRWLHKIGASFIVTATDDGRSTGQGTWACVTRDYTLIRRVQ